MKKGRGFTIMEVLVALVLVAILIITLTKVFTAASSSNSIIAKTTMIYQNARNVLDRISRELKMAVPVVSAGNCYAPYIFKSASKSGFFGSSADDELFFISPWNADDSNQKSDMVEFGYYRDGNNILYRLEAADCAAGGVYDLFPPTSNSFWFSTGTYREVARGIREFTVTYFLKGSTVEQLGAWNPTANSAQRGIMPGRIRITIKVASPEDIQKYGAGPKLDSVTQTFRADVALLNAN